MPYKDKEKQREYVRLWIARRRADYLADKSCAVCGATENLEVDHVDPSTKVHHAIWSWSQERRELELAKCQILCNKHHKEKTSAWWAANRKHGISMYENHGCRCDICKKAKSDKNAKRYRPQ